ncbi:MAG: hypothetical protein O2999_13435 [Nitrospirae bacterium]|nr:hypothetical protein [Nitrospirota bacterium]MDA1305275.1 hypothetical protein [Nitrospirota bacterium]
MVSFSPDFSNLTKFANLFSHAGGRSTQSYSKVDVHTQTQTGLTILTAEGDKVTLSTNAAFQGTGVKYNARGVAEGQALTLRSNSLEGSFISEKQITIEGDLNEQEIQDIKKIVNQVNGLREDVASGDLNTILANGEQIKASGSIASVDLKIKHSESVSAQQAFIQQKTKNEQSAYPFGAINNDGQNPSTPSSTSFLDLLKGLFQTAGSQTRDSDGPSGAGGTNHSQTQLNQQLVENNPGSLSKKVENRTNKAVQGLNEFLDNIGEKILKGAQKIARLANQLKSKVERQSQKIADAYEKLSDAIANGKEHKAERIQDKIDRRINRLDDTTERYGTRIERTANKLSNLIEKLTDRLFPSEATESEVPANPVSEPTEAVAQVEPEAEIHTTANV